MIGPASFDSYRSIENDFGRKNRYSYAVVERGPARKFLKTSLSPIGIGDIKRELVWADFMTFVEKRYPAAKIRSPRDCQLLDESNLLMEYIEAPVVSLPGDGAAWRKQIDRYVDNLIVLDRAAGSYLTPDNLRTYQTRSIETALQRWLRDVTMTADIEHGLDYIKLHSAKLDYRVQHGDLTPWQIFDTNEEWVIFDGERAGDDLPRYNDLAYSYLRLAISCRDITTANYMLGQFIQRRAIDTDNFWEAFIPVAVFRTLGMVGDATRDGSEADLSIAKSLLQNLLDESVVNGVTNARLD